MGAMMARFLTQAMVVEARQWLPGIQEAGVTIPGGKIEQAYVETRAGRRRVEPGDWVFMTPAGERFACKPEAFAALFEPVEEDDHAQG